MKAFVLEQFNQPYQLQDIEIPSPREGEVLVKIAASGINPLDLKIMAGGAAHAQTRLPAILGIDMAGTVVKTGRGVTEFNEGDDVYGMTGGIAGVQGSLAEFAVVDASLLAIKPASITMREAAALPLSFITAWEGLVDRAAAGPGKTVLIHGGAGGVGHIAVQIAVARGADVYATAKPDDHKLVTSYGAVPIDYLSLTMEQYVDFYTGGKGFDIILDTIGGAVLDASFKAAKRYTGHVVSILGWGTHSLAPLSFRGATYSGVFTLYPLISGEGRAKHGEILRRANHLIREGFLTPRLHPEAFTMDTIGAAYSLMEKGQQQGKVVVDIS